MDRPQQLRQLLRALGRLDAPGPGHREIVIVVDNSPDASAHAVVEEAAASAPERYRYAHEPRRGLAFARNRALGEAMLSRADLIAFIDDDEMPAPRWLGSLVSCLDRCGGVAAVGPVAPVFSAPPPTWLPVAAHGVERCPDGQGYVQEGHTGNAILCAKFVRRHALRFDRRHNEIGGEDTHFFKCLREAGGRIAWASNALVYESVPQSRMTLGWIWRRWQRTAAIEAILNEDADRGTRARLGNVVRGVIRIVAGAGLICWTGIAYSWTRPDLVMASSYTLCRGIGFLTATMGARITEYGSPKRH